MHRLPILLRSITLPTETVTFVKIAAIFRSSVGHQEELAFRNIDYYYSLAVSVTFFFLLSFLYIYIGTWEQYTCMIYLYIYIIIYYYYFSMYLRPLISFTSPLRSWVRRSALPRSHFVLPLRETGTHLLCPSCPWHAHTSTQTPHGSVLF